MSKAKEYKCNACDGRGKQLNIGGYNNKCIKCGGTGKDRLKELEEQNKKFCEALMKISKLETCNPYRQCIECTSYTLQDCHNAIALKALNTPRKGINKYRIIELYQIRYKLKEKQNGKLKR